MCLLSATLGYGEGGPFQLETADTLQERAETGDTVAQFYLGDAFDVVDGIRQDGAEAVRWFRLAADQGHADAQATIETWRVDYNAVQPHSALHGQTPWQFARASTGARGTTARLLKRSQEPRKTLTIRVADRSGRSRTMSRRISSGTPAGPGPRRPLSAYLRAISCRCHRSKVSGLTSVSTTGRHSKERISKGPLRPRSVRLLAQ